MREFHFNGSDVCLNPNSSTFKCSRKYEAIVDVAEIGNGWSFGTGFFGDSEGHNKAVWKEGPKFRTERDAYEAGINYLINAIESKQNEKYKSILSMLKDEVRVQEPTNQLTLF
jgi:hypothetical protein